MYRASAGPANAASTPPPVPEFHRWRCPLCGAAYRHPWDLAAHLARPPARLGHALPELDAWTMAVTVAPVDLSPGQTRYPTMPVMPMAAPPLAAVR